MSKVKKKDLRKQIRHLEAENFELAVAVIEFVGIAEDLDRENNELSETLSTLSDVASEYIAGFNQKDSILREMEAEYNDLANSHDNLESELEFYDHLLDVALDGWQDTLQGWKETSVAGAFALRYIEEAPHNAFGYSMVWSDAAVFEILRDTIFEDEPAPLPEDDGTFDALAALFGIQDWQRNILLSMFDELAAAPDQPLDNDCW